VIRRTVAVLVGLASSLALVRGAGAQVVISVSDSAGLQSAINTAPNGAIIELAAGTYAAPAGGFTINDRGTSFTIRAASAASVVLDGQNARDILRFLNSSLAAGGPVTFQDLTFANGLSTTSGLAGGMTMQRARATFIGCVFQNNRANAAGGILVSAGSTAHFLDVTWSGNSARDYGGGLAVEGAGSEAVIHDSQFIGNRTNLPGHAVSAGGGGIHVGNASAGLVTLRVTNTRFQGNEAGYVGGALYAIGSWQGDPSIPTADVTVADCLFVDNKAKRDPSVVSSAPTEGGAFHAEDQTKARIYNSRFVTNSADTGGGVNLYRADVQIEGSTFQGNQAVGTANSATGFGGAISAISNDANDATTGGGVYNRRSAILAVKDSLFQGRFGAVTTVGQNGGCLYASGDSNRLYGLNGVSANGDAATNRATVSVSGSAFGDCDVVQTQANTGRGGAVFVDLVAFTLSGSVVVNSDALPGSTTGAYTAGGGLELIDQTSATVSDSTLARNTAGCYGGGILVQGATLVVDGSRLTRNGVTGTSACGAGLGATMFSGPIPGSGAIPDLSVTGEVKNSVISESTGSAIVIFDDDRTNSAGQINTVVYNNNQIRGASSGATIYQDSIAGAFTVAGLNALVVTRVSGGNTDKSPASNNTEPASNPVVGQIVAVPPDRLTTASPSEAAPTTSYLGYGWGGATNATLNGATRSGNAGLEAATSVGLQTLTVSSSTFTDTLSTAATPQAVLTANPATVPSGGSSQLSWATPGGTLIEANIDQGVGYATVSSGSAIVTPWGTTTYRYFAITEEGGATASATVSVTGGSGPTISSFTASTVLVNPFGSSTLSWSVSPGASLTLNGTVVSGPTGSRVVNPGTTTSYTLVATNSFGTTSGTVTVYVSDGTAGLGVPVVTTPTSGQTVQVTGVGFGWTGVGGASGYDIRVFEGTTGVLLFSGSLLGGGSTSTLVSLPGGSYRFAVRACSGGFAASQCGRYGSVGFTVSPAGPSGSPTVTYPTQGATLVTSTQTLMWTAVAPNPALSGLSYEVLLRDLAAGTTALQITVPSPNLSTIFTMGSSSEYELKVRACQAGCGPWSTAVTFAVSLPAVPTASPVIGGCAVSGGNSLTCTWSPVSRADAYRVQVVQPPPAGPGGGALTVAARQVSGTTVTFPVPAGSATVYLAGCNGDGCGPYATSGIAAPGPNPTAPNIGTPMAGTVVVGPGVLFTWNRVPGDDGTNTWYRLYVQDLSRQSAALDVYTRSNYYSAYFKAEGARYDALVVSNPGLGSEVTGPAQGFNVSGASATSPTMVSPAHNSTVGSGNVQLGWSPVPGATLYEYFVAVLGQASATVRGVTPGLLAQVPLTGSGGGTVYSGIVRACPEGATCAPGSDAGWGPWSNAPGGPGVTNFTVTP
jgi:hypothetical protein